MRDTQAHQVVILSLNLGDNTIETAMIEDWGYKSKIVDGCWNGTKETSHIVIANSEEAVSDLLLFADLYSQEEIMIVRKDRSAYSVSVSDGKRKELGMFVGVSKVQAEQHGSYTFDPSLRQYYIAR